MEKDNRIDHWGVGFYRKDGSFGGVAAGLRCCIDKADAETVAARYRVKYDPDDYRAVPFNRQGYIVK